MAEEYAGGGQRSASVDQQMKTAAAYAEYSSGVQKALLTFDEDMTTLTTGGTRSERPRQVLQEIQARVAECRAQVGRSMAAIHEALQGSAKEYAAASQAGAAGMSAAMHGFQEYNISGR